MGDKTKLTFWIWRKFIFGYHLHEQFKRLQGEHYYLYLAPIFFLPSKCYKVFGFVEEERKNWQEARKACIGFGGNLVSIRSEKEQGMQTIV